MKRFVIKCYPVMSTGKFEKSQAGVMIESFDTDDREEAEAKAFDCAFFYPYYVRLYDNATGKYLRGCWE